MLPPDQTGLLYTGTPHGPLVQGGTVRDGPQRLPGHVRPLRGGEHRPGVPGPDQPLHVPGLLGVGRDDDQEGEGDHLKYGDDILSPQSPLSALLAELELFAYLAASSHRQHQHHRRLHLSEAQ